MTLQRTGRATVYTNQVPYETDILRTNMYKMADISTLAQTVLGTGLNNGTLVQGGDCIPTDPASLSVDILPITIYQNADYDATDYGVIPADTDNILYKQGINLDTTNIPNLIPSITMGVTNYYLIQAELLTSDVNVVSRPYYNSVTPSTPIFNSESDTRVDTVALTVKVSTSATPTPDSGNVGLWAVTVPYGTSSITSGDIAQYANAPFITESLTQKISATTAQIGAFSYALDSSVSANTVTTAFTPTITALTIGMIVKVKIANTNTGPTTISVNGISNNIYKQSYTGARALAGNELVVGQEYLLAWDGSQWELLNPTVPAFVGAKAYLNNNISFTADTNIKITYDTSVYDTSNIFDATDKRFNIPFSGFYRITTNLLIDPPGSAADKAYWATIFINGNSTECLYRGQFVSGSTATIGGNGSSVLGLTAGDYVEIFATQSDTGHVGNIASPDLTTGSSIFNSFQIELVGN